ncbi:MAG: response regulator [Candidatus Melainabacteria bacterium]
MKAMPSLSSQPTETDQRLRILIVDDHAVVRQGTTEMLARDARLSVVASLPSGELLMQTIRETAPDLLLLDIHLPGKNGLQLLEEVRATYPELFVVMFSAMADLPYVHRSLRLKANGYLSKTIDASDLVALLLKVSRGVQPVFSADIAEKMQAPAPDSPVVRLTPRELDTLGELARGYTNQQIADALSVSVKTVDTHVANMMKKFEVNNRTQLLSAASEQGLI